MTIKTYSRARTAVAFVNKVLADHTAVSSVFAVTAKDVGADRWTARVDFADAEADLPAGLVEALEGFELVFPAVINTNLGNFDPTDEELAQHIGKDLAGGTIHPQPTAEDEAAYAEQQLEAGQELTEDDYAELAEVGDPDGAELEEPKKTKKPAYIHEASVAEGPTKRVWAIADSMPGAKRKDVIEACRKVGIAFGTARTQYQKWYKAQAAE